MVAADGNLNVKLSEWQHRRLHACMAIEGRMDACAAVRRHAEPGSGELHMFHVKHAEKRATGRTWGLVAMRNLRAK